MLVSAISLSINGCTSNGVGRMEDEHTKKKKERNDSIFTLLNGCGFSSEEIQALLPGNFRQDNLNKAILPMGFRQEDEINSTNAYYLLSRSLDFLGSMDHLLCKGNLSSNEASEIKDDIEKFTNLIITICSKGFNINDAHLVYDQNKKLIWSLECGNTMLMSVISGGRDITSMPALLMLSDKVNANPFITDIYKKNALHFLLLKGHKVQTPIIDAILNRKDITEHINDVTRYGDTAMHIACARRDEKYITQLLEKGARSDIKNNDGQTEINLLHLGEKQRLDFLEKYLYIPPEHTTQSYYCAAMIDSTILDLEKRVPTIDTRTFDSEEGVATMDKGTFNSDPNAIEKNIKIHLCAK